MERVILILAVLVLAQAAGEKEFITEQSISEDSVTLKCDGKWQPGNENILKIGLLVDKVYIHTCEKDPANKATLYAKVRTAANLIEVDVLILSLIIGGNVVMYVLLGWVVYSLSSQPRAQRTFSGNKASDKQVLIPNGERDTYQQLNANQKSEYSALGKRH